MKTTKKNSSAILPGNFLFKTELSQDFHVTVKSVNVSSQTDVIIALFVQCVFSKWTIIAPG
uniref:Uncharacterized protein n=1 Tax=Arion vulgaris TaxID=1028688 RepID=A0A0B6YD94_9EUPU